MITKYKALEILLKHTKHLPSRNGFKNHVTWVSEIAFRIANKIKKKHPELDINPNKIRIAWLLHDIGKGRDGHHELNSAEILREEWLHEIADIIIHGFVYELFLLEWKDIKEYLPKTIENKIIIYADLLFHQEEVTLHERIKEIKDRKKHETKKIKALELAEFRLHEMAKEIENLM
jgi:hypothetical protein